MARIASPAKVVSAAGHKGHGTVDHHFAARRPTHSLRMFHRGRLRARLSCAFALSRAGTARCQHVGAHSRGAGPESSDSSSGSETPLPRDEVVAELGSGNRVQIAGLAARLPNGRYTYDLRPLDHTNPPQFNLVLQKTAPSITLALPSSGLYVLTIADDLNTPRIDLFIAAVKPAQAASVEKSFGDAKALMKKWIGNYSGWPIHEFQWAYLESLMMDPKPLSTGGPTGAAGKAASNAGVPRGNTADDNHRAGVAAEPTFSPRPGLFDGDTAVTLRCETPGATMRYTVDGSQPHTSSPIYRAPIMVKGTELTIKSFASAAGRKDSAVVTGIFRIRQ